MSNRIQFKHLENIEMMMEILNHVQFQQMQSMIDNDKEAIRRLRRIKKKALVQLVIRAKRDKRLEIKLIELKKKIQTHVEEDR